jgi:ATP-binding protein involved in chromosome partitioning
MIQEKIIEDISKVMHPAINFSLVDLGIVKNINIIENKTTVVFAFPFPNIPIAEQLVNSVSKHVLNNGSQFDHKIVLMTENEKSKFMQLEAEGWKGMS